jgi:hypothetical protein
VLQITAPTLRKNYFRELKFRDEQRDRMDASLAMHLWKQVEGGNVAAMKEFRALVERNDLMLYGQAARSQAADKPKEPKLGKKEQMLADAQHPDTDSILGELMAEPVNVRTEPMWDLSCPDWEDRLCEGRSLIPDLPLVESEARLGLRFFDELQLPDVPGLPKMRDAAGQWFRDIVRVAFGSWDPVARVRYIRDIFAMLPKGQSKTTYIAGLLIVALLMNKRPRAETLFAGPTQAIVENAYDRAVGMIDASRALKRRFRTRDHVKDDRAPRQHTELKIKTFDINILTGAMLVIAVFEEIHLLGRNPQATKVLRQIRGGLEKTPEGLLLMPTTQSDEPPAGLFRDELHLARKIRDGAMRGKTCPADAADPLRISQGDRDRACQVAGLGLLADGDAQPWPLRPDGQPGEGLGIRKGQGRARHRGVGELASQH